MAIEPINSIMTAQANAYQPSPNTNKTAMEYTDVSVAENTPKVDEVTEVVENVEGKESSSYGEEQKANNEKLHQAVETLSKKMNNNAEAVFGIHEETNRVTIKIVDKDTHEVIKELPPEKTLDMIASVWEIAGILVDERR